MASYVITGYKSALAQPYRKAFIYNKALAGGSGGVGGGGGGGGWSLCHMSQEIVMSPCRIQEMVMSPCRI